MGRPVEINLRAADQIARSITHRDDHRALAVEHNVGRAHFVLRADGCRGHAAIARGRIGRVERVSSQRKKIETELALSAGVRAQSRRRNGHLHVRNRRHTIRAEDQARDAAGGGDGDVVRYSLPIAQDAPAGLSRQVRHRRLGRDEKRPDEHIRERIASSAVRGRARVAVKDAAAAETEQGAGDRIERRVAHHAHHLSAAEESNVIDVHLRGGRHVAAAAAAIAQQVSCIKRVRAKRNEIEKILPEWVRVRLLEIRAGKIHVHTRADGCRVVAIQDRAPDRAERRQLDIDDHGAIQRQHI